MSRIGKKPINLPPEVTVEVEKGKVVTKGPKGSISRVIRPEVKVEVKDQQVLVSVNKKSKQAKAFHGLFRSLIANDVQGVSQGWEKTLEMTGVGYRAKMEGENLNIEAGFSHPVIVKPEKDITFKVEGNNKIIVQGIRKDQVGLVAARLRAIRPPEPYKGKGIHYVGEEIRRKEGKKVGGTTASQ